MKSTDEVSPSVYRPSEEAMNSMRVLAGDLMSAAQASYTSLSLCVNDSAGGIEFDECYKVQHVLGEGGFAFVYRCQHRINRRHYAVKEIIKEQCEDNPGEDIQGEIRALKRLREGPFVVRLLDVFEDATRTHLVMEEMKGGDLLDRILEKERYSEQDARKVSRTLFEAIGFCHKKGICHRDIKPENILLTSKRDDTSIKLADFGCSKRITGKPNGFRTQCGTHRYSAPEIYLDHGYDERCDFWSAGVTIFAMMSGYAPFEGTDDEIMELILAASYDFDDPCWDHVSDQALDLICGLLEIEPDRRLSVNDALDSKWLRRRDKQLLEKWGNSSFDGWLKEHGHMSLNSFDLEASISSIGSDGSLTVGDL